MSVSTDIGVKALEVPRSWNGYAAVSQPALHIRADEVEPGDILLLQDRIFRVTGIDKKDISYPLKWYALHIQGDTNIIRFPDEIVTVIREGADRG